MALLVHLMNEAQCTTSTTIGRCNALYAFGAGAGAGAGAAAGAGAVVAVARNVESTSDADHMAADGVDPERVNAADELDGGSIAADELDGGSIAADEIDGGSNEMTAVAAAEMTAGAAADMAAGAAAENDCWCSC